MPTDLGCLLRGPVQEELKTTVKNPAFLRFLINEAAKPVVTFENVAGDDLFLTHMWPYSTDGRLGVDSG